MKKSADIIKNSTLVTDFFGYWPNFHDSEIVEVKLERTSPSVEIKLYTFEMLQEVDKNKCYKLDKYCLIKFEFSDIKEVQIQDFNNQNIVSEISFTQVGEDMKVTVDASYGMWAVILCKKVSVKELKPLDVPLESPKGKFMRGTARPL